MRSTAIAFAVLVALTGVVAFAPAAEAAPPNLPPGSSGCDYFHWHNGNIRQGTPPGYHYHVCY